MRERSALRSAQLRIIDELKTSIGVQAIVGMGGGKTVSALTAIRDLLDEGKIRAAVVVAPRLVAADTWPNEVKAWAHLKDTDLVLLEGGPEKRESRLRQKHEVYVVGLDNVVWLLEALTTYANDDPRRDLLVIDELSRFGNPRGVRAQEVLAASLAFNAIWGLTGTPRPNDEADQYMPLQIVSAGEAFDQSFDEWRRGHFRPLDFKGYDWKIHDFAKPLLMKTVNEWSFTIPPEDAADMPFNSGDEYDLFFDLSPAQQRDLASLDKELLVELGMGDVDLRRAITEGDDDVLFALSKATASGKMSQVLQGYIYEEGAAVQHYQHNRRLDALDALVGGNAGEPLLLPYWFKEDVPLLRKVLGKKLTVLSEEKSSPRTVAAWNAGDLPYMALHPASAGHGLNLQFGGRRLGWFACVWSAEMYIQTCKRLARPGQKLPVFSHRLRARHWLEDLRVNRVERKVAEEQAFIAQVVRV